MSDGLTFRVAGDADWSAIGPIVRSIAAAGDTYTLPLDLDDASARRAWMRADDGRSATFVAERDGTVVATAYVKANHDGPGDHVANAGWMVDPTVVGSGVGRRFAGFVIDEARRRGYLAMQFNSVVATNVRALNLWESLGFAAVGRVPGAFRHPTEGLVDTVVMHRWLVAEPARR